MEKTTFAMKIDKGVLKDFKSFCKEHGIKYSFFIEEAVKEKLEEEELKEDILDFKTLRKEEKLAIPFEKYLRRRGGV
jgi:metal-responsive CopG/Arc/MetJ family transcriptional regulator